MRIVHVLAGAPGNRCGVLDYTNSLVEALGKERNGTECALVKTWSLSEALRIARAHRDNIIHVQYPSLGMGRSPWWALLALLPKRSIVTLHEYRIFSAARKLYCLPAAVMAKQIVFSNEDERRAFLSWYPFAANSCTVIPVGNNIPVASSSGGTRERRLIYFGQIGENKGLDLVIEAVAALRSQGSKIPVAFVGAVTDPTSPVVSAIREAASKHDVELRLNLSSEDVSKELALATHAYLPFPDGISDKRGSALACLKHGVALLTTHSEQTPRWLRAGTTHCATPLDAVLHVLAPELPAIDSETLRSGLAEREWPSIAGRHLAIYDSVGS